MSELESSSSRLAKFEKCEFTNVNDHFEKEHNAEIGLYRQTLTVSSLHFQLAYGVAAISILAHRLIDTNRAKHFGNRYPFRFNIKSGIYQKQVIFIYAASFLSLEGSCPEC